MEALSPTGFCASVVSVSCCGSSSESKKSWGSGVGLTRRRFRGEDEVEDAEDAEGKMNCKRVEDRVL